MISHRHFPQVVENLEKTGLRGREHPSKTQFLWRKLWILWKTERHIRLWKSPKNVKKVER